VLPAAATEDAGVTSCPRLASRATRCGVAMASCTTDSTPPPAEAPSLAGSPPTASKRRADAHSPSHSTAFPHTHTHTHVEITQSHAPRLRSASLLRAALLRLVAALVLSVAAFLIYRQQSASAQLVAHDLRGIRELPVDELRVYARAACVSGADFASVKHALHQQLRGIPRAMREELVDSALTEGVSTTSSVQDTTSAAAEMGKAVSYIGFWSTRYDAGAGPVGPMYSTCVTASGVDIRVGEEVAGWETSVQNVVVGYDPCRCAMLQLYCRACARTEERTTKRPIFKRHKLTLQNQIELHRWMVKEAVDRALAIQPVNMGSLLRGPWAATDRALPTTSWTGPADERTFLGGDKADGGVVSGKDEL
jgi:hypothetical protein